MKEFLMRLFNQYPTIRFAVDIVKYSSIKHLQADELVLLFLQLDQHIHAIQFVEQLIDEKGTNCDKGEADKLQTCFDLLKKYSYLVDEKVSQSANLFFRRTKDEICFRRLSHRIPMKTRVPTKLKKISPIV